MLKKISYTLPGPKQEASYVYSSVVHVFERGLESFFDLFNLASLKRLKDSSFILDEKNILPASIFEGNDVLKAELARHFITNSSFISELINDAAKIRYGKYLNGNELFDYIYSGLADEDYTNNEKYNLDKTKQIFKKGLEIEIRIYLSNKIMN